MMLTFARSPLSFRTAGFPRYGWKAGFSSGAFLDRQQLKPAPGIRAHPPSCTPRSQSDDPALCRAADSIAHHLGELLLLHSRRSGPGYMSRSVITQSTPVHPTRGHTAISPHGGLYAMPLARERRPNCSKIEHRQLRPRVRLELLGKLCAHPRTCCSLIPNRPRGKRRIPRSVSGGEGCHRQASVL
jgi:hypothetical protein